MSNLRSLPKQVSDFTRLYHEKRKLNAEVYKLNVELRRLEHDIIEQMSQEDLDAYELLPSDKEVKKYGSPGALQLKVRNDYDRLSKDNLIRFCIQFFRYIMPEADDQETTRLGYGQAEWIWANRGRTPKKWLDRVYIEDLEKKSVKRNQPEQSAVTTDPNAKKSRSLPPNNVPKTREDFMNIASLQSITCPSQS